MLQKLIDIRNAVEHEDVPPPDLETCKVFAEYTWYFLKSTDRMLQEVASSFELLPSGNDEEYYWLIVEYGPDNQWRPKIRGWIKPEMILKQEKSEWLSLKLEKTESRKQLTERLKGTPGAVKRNEEGRGKKSVDIFITGELRGPASALANIIRAYFSLT
jgi:hypothetical protein